MKEFLKYVFTGQNQFASGGLLLMIIGGISVYLRALPAKLWQWIIDQSTMTLTVKDDDAAFIWVKEWFLEQEFLKRIRRLDLDTTDSQKIALYRKFFPEATESQAREFVEAHASTQTMAEFQGLLLALEHEEMGQEAVMDERHEILV